MSKLIRRFIAFAILSVPALMTGSGLHASLSDSQNNGFQLTHKVLTAFYPEVFNKKWYLNVSTGCPVDSYPWGNFSGFVFKITRFSPNVSFDPTFDTQTGKLVSEPENSTFLEGRTWVTDSGEINSFVATGELAHSRQLKDFQEFVEAHPEWSNQQAIQKLKDVRALYGPEEKNQFVSSLDFAEKAKFLGRARIVSVEFRSLPEDHVGSFAGGAFEWVVDAEFVRPDKSRSTITFWFEPFQGKLIHIHRNGAPVG